MFIEKRYIKRIENIFAGLSVPIQLLDAQGFSIVPEEGESKSLPSAVMAPGITHQIGKDYIRALDLNPQLYLTCNTNAESAENLLKLADAMLMSMLKSSLSIASQSDVLRRVLRQDEIGTALVSRANEHQIPLDMERSVMIFQIENTDRLSAYATLGELIPLSETDTLVEMNRHNTRTHQGHEQHRRHRRAVPVRPGRGGNAGAGRRTPGDHRDRRKQTQPFHLGGKLSGG